MVEYQKKLLKEYAQSNLEYNEIDTKTLTDEQRKEIKLLNDRGLIERKANKIKICGLLSNWIRSYL